MTILLTGASGVVGLPTLRALTEDHDVVVVEGRRAVQHSGITVRGDLRAPHLGLDDRTWSALTRDVDTVVHCAGVVDFGIDDASTRPSTSTESATSWSSPGTRRHAWCTSAPPSSANP